MKFENVIKRGLFLLLLIFVAIAASSCTDKSGAVNLLSSQGYEKINITGYRFFGCGEDDFFKTGFSATNKDGYIVSGVICKGFFFKSSTIRFD